MVAGWEERRKLNATFGVLSRSLCDGALDVLPPALAGQCGIAGLVQSRVAAVLSSHPCARCPGGQPVTQAGSRRVLFVSASGAVDVDVPIISCPGAGGLPCCLSALAPAFAASDVYKLPLPSFGFFGCTPVLAVVAFSGELLRSYITLKQNSDTSADSFAEALLRPLRLGHLGRYLNEAAFEYMRMDDVGRGLLDGPGQRLVAPLGGLPLPSLCVLPACPACSITADGVRGCPSHSVDGLAAAADCKPHLAAVMMVRVVWRCGR